jgi:hypothetical protein
VKFTWSLKNKSKRDSSTEDVKWLAKYENLLEFHQEHDHCHCIVTSIYEKDKSLGIWVKKQRAINQEGTRPPDRFKLMEDIEFVWEVDFADPDASLTQRQ